MIVKKPKGTHDILPDEIYKWQNIEKKYFLDISIVGYLSRSFFEE